MRGGSERSDDHDDASGGLHFMKTIFCALWATLALVFWILAWSTLDFRFVLVFLLILVMVWAITRLLLKHARTLALILFGLLSLGFIGALTTVPVFREAVSLLVRETLQFEGARLFVWAVLFTIIFGVNCLARSGSHSAR
jgi:hypothetical protein